MFFVLIFFSVAPEVQLRNKRIGQVKGRETILDCRITASPQGVTVWMRDGKELFNSEKYSIEVFNEGGHTITLSLRITQIVDSDFGDYTCLASNHLGRDKETMLLYGTLFDSLVHDKCCLCSYIILTHCLQLLG